MNIAEKLNTVLSEAKLTTYKLSQLSGVPQSTLYYIMSGERSPTLDTLEKICRALNMTMSDLFNNNSRKDYQALSYAEQDFIRLYRASSNPFREVAKFSLMKGGIIHDTYASYTAIDPSIPTDSNYETDNQSITIPVVGRAAAGSPIEMIECIDNVTSDSCQLYIPGDFAVIAVGESMINAGIHNGDRVIFRPQDMVFNGEIALVAVNDDSTIKRFYRYNDRVELKPENDEYKPLIIRATDKVNVRILGKFISVL